MSAFAQQHGDPTGTRSSALNVFIPDALATGRYELRADSYVRELVLDERGRIKGAVYEDADGVVFEQEADVFLLACGAVETARLMLMSTSGRFPNGLANSNDLVGRNVTFHEYSASVATFDDPIYAWAGGGYVSASSSSSTSTTRAAASSAAVTSRRPASASPCPSTGGCPGNRPGEPRPSRSTATTSATRWR